MLAHGLAQLSQWRRRGHALTLSINLSRLQVLDAEFGRSLLQQVKRQRLRPAWITLEITERESVLAHALGRQRLEALAAAGFLLSVDDFGAGYSSFELVGAMPFDELKIHLGLIRRMADPKGRRIVQAIVEMAKTLGLRVVAEGVETEVIQEALREMGAHKLQGYFFARPLQAGAFLSYVDAQVRPGTARKRAA